MCAIYPQPQAEEHESPGCPAEDAAQPAVCFGGQLPQVFVVLVSIHNRYEGIVMSEEREEMD
jgi:hypothetical protein